MIIQGGNYELAKPLVFDPQDSGTETYSIQYVAAPGEVVTISGGRRIKNWRNSNEGYWESELTEVKEIGYNEIQAAQYGTQLNAKTYMQPVAIECVYAQDCIFEACRFAHLNSSGIGLGQGCRDNILSRCTIEDIGGTGVVIGWRGKGELEDGNEGTLDADWKYQSDAPTGNVVSNCFIRRCGSDSFGGVGVFVAFSKDTRITHNQIHDLPYTGVSVGYRWNTSATSQTGCIVEDNHIFDVRQKLADGGGVYTLGFQPGTVFRGNHIHDVHRSQFAHGGAPNNGFFIDEGSQGLRFDSNVIHSISGDPVRFNNCKQEWQEWNANYLGAEAAQSNPAGKIIDNAGVETAEPAQLHNQR